jgi:hypothetical protein
MNAQEIIMSERIESSWRRRTGFALAGLSGAVVLAGGVAAVTQAEESPKSTATPLERPQRNELNQAAKDAVSRALKRYLESETTGCPSAGECHQDTYDGVLEYRQNQTVSAPNGEASWFMHQTIKAVTTNKSGVELDMNFTSTDGFTDTPGVYTQDTIKSASWREEGLVLTNPNSSTLTATLTPDAVRAFLIDPDTTISKVKSKPENVTTMVGPDGIDLQYDNVNNYTPKLQGAAVLPFVMKQVTGIADEVR